MSGDVIVTLDVHGRPMPQGSKTVINGHPIESSRGLKDWRRAIADKAGEKMGGRGPVDVPLKLAVAFYLPRPRAHFGTGRNAGVLKSSAPARPTTTPDLDKLVRAVCDALTGIVWRTDADVVTIEAGKFYADRRGVGAEVVVRR